MAQKRRAVSVDTDSESEQSQTKRARTKTNLGDEPPVATTSKTKSRRAQDAADDNEPLVIDEEEDVGEEAPNADDEKKFEEQHEELIRAKVMNTNKTVGSIAEMGIIEKLELHQFMCHRYLEFTFGPQINFIIGHNGSGKSAVLSALTVALGGKATVTGRGSGLKSFIREGQGAAEVSVVLKNQGEDAYRHKEYGDSIIVTRRFTKEGSSSYKIKSKDGKVISTKRDELSAICDHMNIQVDNPMNILTQDSARQFLSASQPADKYRFFLRGTQLSQLSEEYSTCMENISQTQKILKNKSEVLPDLEDALEEAIARFKEAEKARDLQHKCDDLKKELAWSHVAAKEQELQEKVGEAERVRAKLPRIIQHIDEAELRFLRYTEELQQAEARHGELGNIEHLVQQKKAIDAQLTEIKKTLSEIKENQRQINTMKQNVDTQIQEYEAQIAAEQQRDEASFHAKRNAAQAKLDAVVLEQKAKEAELTELNEQRVLAERDFAEARQQHNDLRNQLEAARQAILDTETQLRLIADRERSKLAPYGRNIEAVLNDIGRAQWYGRKPVGPLGQYVRVRDQTWAPVMRVRLGGLMTAFAITDSRDRKTLDQILKRHGNNPQIIISEVDLFDYTRGEPPAEFLTVLRALEVSDEWVLRLLINSASIETILLAPTRRDGDDRLSALGSGLAWTNDAYTVERFRGGGGRSTLAAQLRPQDPRHQLFTGDDMAAERRKWEERKADAERHYQDLNFTFQQLADKGRAADAALKKLKTQGQHIDAELRAIRQRRAALQDEANEQLPIGIQAIQSLLDEEREKKANLLAQYADVATAEAQTKEAQRPLMAQKTAIKAQIDEHELKAQACTREIEEAAEFRLKAQFDKNHYGEKLKEAKQKEKDADDVVKQVQTEFTEWTAKAELFCPRIADPRPAEELSRLLDSVQRALKEREKRQGASVEQMAVEVNKKRAALDNAKRELRVMLQLNKSLRKSIRTRLQRWHEFRRHIALRCKIYFSYHLSNRGYFGKVLFDHVAGTLQLKVQTDDQAGTQGGSREKDPRSLSGGEKSFSTICLLLSLWESIGCPIRCLDEFDVFMDAVNRRISMRMMIDTANASDCKQYILITPQDMTNITIGKTVRVHRMSDPERGQGLLSFAGGQ